MANKDMQKVLTADQAKLIGEINAKWGKRPQSEHDALIVKLNEIEMEYRKLTAKKFYHEHPNVVDALRDHDYTVIAHRTKLADGKVIGVEYAEKQVPVDLKAYCEYHQYPLDWYWELQRFNKRLTMRVAEGLGYTKAQLLAIDNSYAMDKLARDADGGKTPTSNTQMVGNMQRVFDLLAPGAGKVNNHDLAYILSCYTKRGKKALRVACSKHGALALLLLDVFHRVVTNGVYNVDYKVVTKSDSPAQSAAPASEDKSAAKPTGKKSDKVKAAAEVKAEAAATTAA